MPAVGVPTDDSGFDMSSALSAAIPYKWEAAPGKPITEIVAPVEEPCRVPLRPPPGCSGVRRPYSFVEPVFDGFEPEDEPVKPASPHMAEKILKKLLKLRKKSLVVAACFSLENLRAVTQHKKRFALEDASERSYDSDDVRSHSMASTFDQPDTPSSSTCSLGSSSCESLSDASGYAIPIQSGSHQPGSQIMANMLLNLSMSDDEDCNDDDGVDETDEFEDHLAGPRESAWHQNEEEDLTEEEWQVVRYAQTQGRASTLVSTLVRQSSKASTGDHSYRLLTMKGSTSINARSCLREHSR